MTRPGRAGYDRPVGTDFLLTERGAMTPDVRRWLGSGGRSRRVKRGGRGRRAGTDDMRSSSGRMLRPGRGARSCGPLEEKHKGKTFAYDKSPDDVRGDVGGYHPLIRLLRLASRPRTSQTSPWWPTSFCRMLDDDPYWPTRDPGASSPGSTRSTRWSLRRRNRWSSAGRSPRPSAPG